jgi:hypothetical protein
MSQNVNVDKLIDAAIGQVPEEFQESLRNWIHRARKSEITKLSEELLEESDTAWQAFQSAAREVERRLQE